MKVRSKILYLVVAMCLTLGLVSAVYASVPDVGGHWAQAEIEKWVGTGLATGYPDGTFKPDNNITRAEFVALLNRSLGHKDPGAVCNFADVKVTDWYYSDVASAAQAGYVNGYEDNTFRPDQVISRVEAGVIVARVLGLPAGNQDAINKFSDASALGDWAKGSISAMVERNLLSGYPDGSFKPNAPVTRAESVVMLDRAQASQGNNNPATNVPVTGIKLSSSTLSIYVGNSAQLTATVEPGNATNKTVTWRSSNEGIATVDNSGKVYGVAVGNAVITATTVDGNMTATCGVTVLRQSSGGGGGGGGGGAVTVKSVTASPPAGAVTPGTTVTLTCATAGATIYYTTDGSTPTSSSTKYTAPITINAAMTIKAYAVKDGMRDSAVSSFTYTIAGGGAGAVSFTKTVLADPVLGTIVTVTIGDADAGRVTGVTVKGVAASKVPNTANKWRAILPAGTTVADADIVCATAPAGTVSFTKTVVADPVLGTIVTVTIGDADAGRVTGVTVKGVAASKVPNTANRWRAILPAGTTVTDADIVCETGAVPPENVAVTGVTLDKTTLTIEQNTTATLVATVSPANATDKTVTWSSSAPDIASVDNGTVTGHLPGSAVITVTTTDGNKSATCNVTVTAAPAGNFIAAAVARYPAIPSGVDVWVTLAEGVTPDANGVTANGNIMTYRANVGKYFYHNDDWTAPTASSPIIISVTVNGVTQTQSITAASL